MVQKQIEVRFCNSTAVPKAQATSFMLIFDDSKQNVAASPMFPTARPLSLTKHSMQSHSQCITGLPKDCSKNGDCRRIRQRIVAVSGD